MAHGFMYTWLVGCFKHRQRPGKAAIGVECNAVTYACHAMARFTSTTP